MNHQIPVFANMTVSKNLFLVIQIFILCSKCFADLPTVNIVIQNESNYDIYLQWGLNLNSYQYYKNIKIHAVNLPVHYGINDKYGDGGPILFSIDVKKSKEINVLADGYIDLRKYKYENGEKIFDGICSSIIFCLYYKKEPFKVNLHSGTYKEYVEEMQENGFVTLGYYKDNTIYFRITNGDYPINDDMVKDFDKFAERISGVKLLNPP